MWLMAWRSRTIAAILALISTLAASLAQIPARLKRTIQFFGLRRPVSVWNEESAPVWSGETLRVLCWNVQYCAGIRQHFFYDGGMAVSTPRAEVFKTATDIGNAIAEANPDVVLLQEVDRGSRRTAFIDEFELLASILYERGLTCRCSASYWRVPYVPHPKHEHVGRVSMHLVTFSRFRISSAVRWQLPLLKESRLRRIFNLRRAALEVDLQVSPGNKPLSLINTHLSAFSYGDGTLTRQVTFILDKILHPKQQHSWLLAGDFNCLSPYEDAKELVEEADLYPKNFTDIKPLYDRFNPAFAEADRLLYTYKPYKTVKPDRTIDHAFASPNIIYNDVRILKTSRFLSDHQPILLDIDVPTKAA